MENSGGGREEYQRSGPNAERSVGASTEQGSAAGTSNSAIGDQVECNDFVEIP